jgi:hypothetical protein
MNSNEKTHQAGVDFTTDSFLMDTYLIFRKTKTEYVCTPSALIQRTSNTFHAYDLSAGLCKNITNKEFYELFNLYEDTGGLTKTDEEYLYDKVIDNNFAMYCLLTSIHM